MSVAELPCNVNLETAKQMMRLTGEKICEVCGESKPATTAYFHADKNVADGFRSPCIECRREKRKRDRKNLAERNVEGLTKAARTIITRSDSKYSDGLKDLVDIGFELWGGREEFMARWVEEFEQATPGGMIRARLLSDFAKLVTKAEEKMAPKPTAKMTDEELTRSLRGFMERLEDMDDAAEE